MAIQRITAQPFQNPSNQNSSSNVVSFGAAKNSRVRFGSEAVGASDVFTSGSKATEEKVTADTQAPKQSFLSKVAGCLTAPLRWAGRQILWAAEKVLPEGVVEIIEHVKQFPKVLKEFNNADNRKMASGVFFKSIVPILLPFAIPLLMTTGFFSCAGIALALAGGVIAYFSGQYGRKLIKDVTENGEGKQSKIWDGVSKLHEVITQTDDERRLKLFNDFTNLVNGFVDTTRFPKLFALLNKALIGENSFLYKLVSKPAMAKTVAILANIYLGAADSDSAKDAAWQGAKKGAGYTIIGVAIPALGRAMKNGPWFVKWAGPWVERLPEIIVGWEAFKFLVDFGVGKKETDSSQAKTAGTPATEEKPTGKEPTKEKPVEANEGAAPTTDAA